MVANPWPEGQRRLTNPPRKLPTDVRRKPRRGSRLLTGAQAPAAKATYRCGTEAPATEAAYRCRAEASAAKAPAHHRAPKATTAKAPAAEASAPAHARIRCRRRCHRAREGDGGQCDRDLTHHDVSSLLEKR